MNIAINKYLLLFAIILLSCSTEKNTSVQSVTGVVAVSPGGIWLSHEHVLVDFIGADSIDRSKWDHDLVINTMSPYLDEVRKYNVKFFVDATPAYLGRDVVLLV